MSQVSDGLRTGNAGLPPDTRAPFVTIAPGVTPAYGAPVQPIGVLDLVPAASGANNIAAFQVVSGAAFTVAAGTGVTTSTINGSVYLDLGSARGIKATGSGVSNVATLITIAGLDEYLQSMTQTFTGPTGTAVTTTTKAFRYVLSASTTGNTVSSVGLGTADLFGLPVRADSFNYMVQLNWAGQVVTASTGFVAAVTSSATATTGDVRGTYTVSSTADGAKRLTGFVYIANPNTNDGVYGVPQA